MADNRTGFTLKARRFAFRLSPRSLALTLPRRRRALRLRAKTA